MASDGHGSAASPRVGGANHDSLVREFAGKKGVSLAAGKGFSSGTLKANGRIFGMLDSRGQLVLKLPAERVSQLLSTGGGQAFDGGRGRPMKEWVILTEGNRRWRALAEEARTFAAAAKR